MIICYADLETSSECDLKKHGTHHYAEHPSTDIQLFSYGFEEGEVKVWDRYTDKRMPKDLKDAFANPEVVFWYHNAWFDRNLNEQVLGIRLPIERYRCSMALALAHGLPAGLGDLGAALGIREDFQKVKDGRRLVLKFCKPDKNGNWNRPEDHPEDWAKYKEYCRIDTISMREIIRKIPKWNATPYELSLWYLDQTVNSRGMPIDLELANAAMEAIAIAQVDLAKKTKKMTNGEVETAGQRDAMLKHILEEYGYEIPNMQKATINRLVDDPETPEPLRELLQVRLSTATTATAKYKPLVAMTSADGRLRGTIQCYGASRTGRDAGRGGYQCQNLARPTMDHDDIIGGIDSLINGTAAMVGFDIMKLSSSSLRYAIKAPKGKKFCIADLSNIEGRALAYLAGEKWKLKAFADFDVGTGHDLYKVAYAKAFNVDPEDVTKEQRNAVGKVLELACFAPDVSVLTDGGYKPIVEVLITDKLWDGIEWVSHQGLLAKGVKKVVCVDGIRLTPDHSVLTQRIWLPAKQLVLNRSILRLALETGSENLPLQESYLAQRVVHQKSRLSAPAGQTHTQSLLVTYGKELLRGVINVPRKSLTSIKKITGGIRTLCRITTNVESYCAESLPASTGVITQTTVGIKITGVVGSGSMNHGELIGERFYDTSRPSVDGITPHWSWIVQRLMEITSRVTCASLPERKTKVTEEKSESCKSELTTWSPVYDLVQAGPRNRFTVKTDSGHLLVHNCGYGGGVGALLVFLRSFKVDLESLAEVTTPTIPKAVLKEADSFYEWMTDMEIAEAKAKAIKGFRADKWEEYYENKRTHGLPKHVHMALESLKRLWRKEHPATVAFWKDTENAVKDALQFPKKDFHFGNGCIARKSGNWVRIILPSGHNLCYPGMRLNEGKLEFKGVSQYTKKWGWIQTTGPKIVENMIQSFARDIFKYGQLLAESKGYQVDMPLHDELVCEVPDTDSYSHQQLEELMATVPPWAKGFPLAAAGFSDYRYRK